MLTHHRRGRDEDAGTEYSNYPDPVGGGGSNLLHLTPTGITARYAALIPFGKVAAFLSELLPMGGAQNTGTVRNRTLRVGHEIVQQHLRETAKRPPAQVPSPIRANLPGSECHAL